MVEVGQDSQQLRNSLPLVLLLGLGVQGPTLGGHVDHEVHHPVAVAEFIVASGRRAEGLLH